MQIFFGALIGALIQMAGTMVGKVLLSLGIGLAVYTGVDSSITWARDFVIASISASHSQTVAAASTLKVGVSISIIFSALVTKMTINGLTGGTLKRWVNK